MKNFPGHSHASSVGVDSPRYVQRSITRSGYQVRGIFPSARFKRTLQWHSRLGCELMYRLEASWFTTDARIPATSIEVAYGDGKRFHFIPHVVVTARDGRLVCIECVWSRYLLDPTHQARHRAIARQLLEQGLLFRVVCETHLDHLHVQQTARKLVQALQTRRTAGQDDEDQAALMRTLPATFGELQSQLGTHGAMRMLAIGHVYFNTHDRLCVATPLSYVFQEHFDAADFLYSE